MTPTHTLELLAPLSGVLVPLDQVPDQVFSSRMVGDGVSIDPTSSLLRAPVAGVVSDLQGSGHAVTVTSACGVQVMMHIGLDTVNLAGKGFKNLVEAGATVEAGQALIEFDADYVAQHARSLLTQMLVVNGERVASMVPAVGLIECGQPVLQLSLAEAREVTADESAEEVVSESVVVPNPNGLHARPAAVLAHAAKAFSASIDLCRDEQRGNAKSLVAIMALQIARGDSLRVAARGADAPQAIEALCALLASGCGESDSDVAAQAPQAVLAGSEPVVGADGLRGVCASPGTALGRVLQIAEQDIAVSERGGDPLAEQQALDTAIANARLALEGVKARLNDSAQAAIFDAQRELLDDPTLLEQAAALIGQGKSAAFAWKSAVHATVELFQGMDNTLLAERAQDLRDVGRRVLTAMLGIDEPVQALSEPVILIAEQLTPSQTVGLDTSKVLGFVTVGGGATSHVAILARALGIPALCGVPASVLKLADGVQVLLDAEHGRLQLEPTPAQIKAFQIEHERQQQRRRTERERAQQPAVTRDGKRVDVVCNLSSLAEVAEALTLGAEGVGLLRSEFLYLDRVSEPSPEEQVSTYQAIARALGPERDLVVRTLDVGGDKPLPYVPMAHEANPFLGMRGIRLCLDRPELLRGQLRAILASAGDVRLHVMFPMISSLDEFRQAREVLVEEARALGLTELPKVGVMIEVPAAALLAERFAPEVDFFSIGTNDLTQYTLAMDRDHPQLAAQADALHPAVLRLIDLTVRAAHAHGKWVGVCGALSSDTQAVPLLVGLGVDELSVSIPTLPAIKAAVRDVRFDACVTLAQNVLGLAEASQVRQLLMDFGRVDRELLVEEK